MPPYDELAAVYPWLVPDELASPEGAANAFAPWLEELPAGARVLDCAAGTGELAVGLALRGFATTATDASDAMLAHARELAAARGTALDVRRCAWEQLPGQEWGRKFDAVLCVGNSLAHAPGRAARRRALAAMAQVLRPGGLLAVTSRNWETLRAERPGLEVADRLVERPGGRGLVLRAWSLPAAWEEPHELEVAVALVRDDGSVATRAERMEVWPFRREELDADLRAAGLAPAVTTYAPEAARYLVCARCLRGATAG